MNTNLILHCGARSIDRERLKNIPCPAHTETWHPIPHIELVNQVERSLKASNMTIANEAYGVTKDNARMFGLLQVARCENPKDYAFVVGLRGALDKSLSRGLAVGSQVFVCDNLAFSSEIVFHRKQTKNIEAELPSMVDAAIGQLAVRWNSQAKRIEVYKNTEVAQKDADHLLAEMAGEVFPWQKFEDIRKEFKAPRHAEFVKGTLWALFNSVTEFLKPGATSQASGLWSMPQRTSLLHKMCDDFAGLVIDTSAEISKAQLEAAIAIAPSAPTIVVQPHV